MADYTSTPVLSKIKIGDRYYYLKDKDARTNLDTLIASLGTAAYVDTAESISSETGLIDAKSVKAYVDSQVAQIKIGEVVIDSAKGGTGDDKDQPATAASKDTYRKLYLVANEKATGSYVEWLTIRSGGGTEADPYSYKWEQIGTTELDLSNYYTKDEVNAAIKVETDRAQGVEGGFETRIKAVEDDHLKAADKTALETAINKKADTDAVNTELAKKVDKAEGKQLSTEDYTTAEKNKLTGIAEGAQVNVIEGIKLNGTQLTPTEKIVDLGSIATTESVVANVTYVADTHTLQQAKGSSAATDVHKFGALADKDTVSSTLTDYITGVESAKVTAAGTISGGVTTAAGTINTPGINLTSTEADVITGVATAGTAPTFTYGAFTANTPTTIDVTKFNGGSAASYSHTGFSGGELGAATKAAFAKEGIKAEVGTGDDSECLIFSAVTTAEAVTEQGTFTAAVYGTDDFKANTVASLGEGFYTAGTAASKADDAFDAGSMPTFNTGKINNVTAAALAADLKFTGSESNVTGATFTGTEVDATVTLAKGEKTIESK